MGEDKNGVQNGDMAPQEDTSKVPLTEENEPAVEVKPETGAGDVKINIDEGFKGLTKEELMQYAKQPFWVRLRIFLMVFFWGAWLAMLVVAILIIVQAPRCEPPPTITWLQHNPLLEMKQNTKPEDATSLLEKLGLKSFYIPGLISDHDYYKMNATYVKETVMAMLQTMAGNSVYAVTDFVPSPTKSYHTWVVNESYSDVMDPNTYELIYESPELASELQKVFEFWKEKYNVTGFLVPDTELVDHPDLRNLTTVLNSNLSREDIVIGESAVDVNIHLQDLDVAGAFKEFVTQNFTDWTYYKYNPISSKHSTASPEQMPAVTLTLMLLPGTPVLQITESNVTVVDEAIGDLVRQCVLLRDKDAIKFGETQFANTTDNVVAFTRTLKGTPGYAVAVNIGSESEAVDFTELEHVPATGTFVYSLNGTEYSTKPHLNDVVVGAHDGVVIQFVAKYGH